MENQKSLSWWGKLGVACRCSSLAHPGWEGRHPRPRKRETEASLRFLSCLVKDTQHRSQPAAAGHRGWGPGALQNGQSLPPQWKGLFPLNAGFYCQKLHRFYPAWDLGEGSEKRPEFLCYHLSHQPVRNLDVGWFSLSVPAWWAAPPTRAALRAPAGSWWLPACSAGRLALFWTVTLLEGFGCTGRGWMRMAGPWESGKWILPVERFPLLRPPQDESGRLVQGLGRPLRYLSHWEGLRVGTAVSAVGSSAVACIPLLRGPRASWFPDWWDRVSPLPASQPELPQTAFILKEKI